MKNVRYQVISNLVAKVVNYPSVKQEEEVHPNSPAHNLPDLHLYDGVGGQCVQVGLYMTPQSRIQNHNIEVCRHG